jgi:hypothetical protein
MASRRLAATMRANLDAGGFIVAALLGETLVGYATTVPIAAVSSGEAVPLDRWHDLPDALELGANRGCAFCPTQRYRDGPYAPTQPLGGD